MPKKDTITVTEPKTKKTPSKKKEKKPRTPKMHLSVSRLNLFDQCPQKYYYRYILGLPDAPTYHTAAGSFLHKALEMFVLEYTKTPDLRLAAQEAYKKAKVDPEITELGDLITPSLCDEVKGWLKSYVQKYEKDTTTIPKFLKAEKQFRFGIPNSNIIVNGFIDRIDEVGTDSVRVLDYKTTSRPDYLDPFQLVVYTIPVMKMYPGKKVLASYELARQSFENKHYEVTDKDRQEALDKFVTVGSEIQALLDSNNPKLWKIKPSTLCNYCPYRVQCAKDNQSCW